VLANDGTELGYVPREEALEMAPLLDAGASAEATVKKIVQTSDGLYVIPVVISILRHGDNPSPLAVAQSPRPPHQPPSEAPVRGAKTSPLRIGLMVVGLLAVIPLTIAFGIFGFLGGLCFVVLVALAKSEGAK
jgi:hypothetical protein